MKKYINFLIIIGFSFIIGLGVLFLNQLFTKKPTTKPVEELPVASPSSNITTSTQSSPKQQPITTILPQPQTTTEETEIIRKIIPVIDKEIIGAKLDYPYLYAYFPQDQTIKKINLEDKTYLELFKDPNIVYVDFSPKFSKAILKFKNDPRYFVLDFNQDRLDALPIFTESYAFVDEDTIIFYRSNQSYLSELGLWRNFESNSLKSLGILNPNFVSLSDKKILIYENVFSQLIAPVFLYDLNQPKNVKILFEPQKYISLFTSDDKNYLVISYWDQKNFGLKTKILDKNLKEIAKFNLGLIKDKCSFKQKLVCALPDDPFFSPIDWYKNKITTKDSIIVFDPATKDLTTIFETNFDLINPNLTSQGLFFINRLSNKLFLVKTENLSL